ncbi:7862_t:CDS:1 [Paraglomus brasilianum]|uniref:7862_t:CDS:1 n=1 Tax=Paraglomus brasilianum TaxID=144538 RepID=A0A9N9D6C3_9GLOM|nr:7862_t:CDS:1 [Paraglomus brasilianum]
MSAQLSSERSFSQLFRQSRLATYDPTLPQVYTTYGPFKKQGDWGLKRNLPKILRTNVITVQALDTSEHQTPFRSAQKLVRFTRKWKENFPWSKFPPPLKDKALRNISLMSEKQFEKFLKEAEEKKQEWRQKKKETYSPESWLQFMNAINEKSPPSVVGLTYSHNNPGTNVLIQGRVLNKELLGYAVGISGIVAHLPSQKALRVGIIERDKVEQFYVEQAEFNESGRLVVRLSQLPTVIRQDTLGYPGSSRLTKGFLDEGARQKEAPDVQKDLLEKIKQLSGGSYIGIGPVRFPKPQNINMRKDFESDQSSSAALFGPDGLFAKKSEDSNIEIDKAKKASDKLEVDDYLDLMEQISINDEKKRDDGNKDDS